MSLAGNTIIKVQTGSQEKGNLRKAEFEYPIPATLAEAITLYTEEAVYGEFLDGITLSLQAPARRALTSAVEGSDYNQVVSEAMRGWKPGMKAQRKARAQVDPVAALASQWDTLSTERKMEIAAKFGMTLSGNSSAAPEVQPSEALPGDEAEAAGRRRR